MCAYKYYLYVYIEHRRRPIKERFICALYFLEIWNDPIYDNRPRLGSISV